MDPPTQTASYPIYAYSHSLIDEEGRRWVEKEYEDCLKKIDLEVGEKVGGWVGGVGRGEKGVAGINREDDPPTHPPTDTECQVRRPRELSHSPKNTENSGPAKRIRRFYVCKIRFSVVPRRASIPLSERRESADSHPRKGKRPAWSR